MMNISKYQRSLFAQLISSILELEIEKGRYNKVPLDLRICNMCHLEVVQDDFLCECTGYLNIMKSYSIKQR